MSSEKTLVVLLHGIGDTLMALPAIHVLKRKEPKNKITVMTIGNPLFHELLEYNTDIDQLLYSSLKKNPHYGNPLKFLLEYRVIKKDIKKVVEQYGFTKVYFIKMFLTSAKIYEHLPIKHYQEHKTTKIAKELGVKLQTKEYSLKYNIKDKGWATNFLRKHNLHSKKLVGLHFTGSAKSKSLSYAQGKRIIEQLKLKGYDLMLFHDKYSYAREEWHYDPKDVVTYVSDSIMKTAALVDQCQKFICVDSGVAHIAAALKKKVLVVYFKKVWQQNSLAIGKKVQTYVYKKHGKGMMKGFRTFLQQ